MFALAIRSFDGYFSQWLDSHCLKLTPNKFVIFGKYFNFFKVTSF